MIILKYVAFFPVSCSHSLISFHGYSIQWKELQLHRHLSPIIWILFTECLIEGTAPWRRSGWPATHLSMLSLFTATGQMQRLDRHYSRKNRNYKASKMKLCFFPQDAASGADGETIAGRRIRVSPARPRTVGPRDRFIPDKYSRDRGKSPSWNRILGLWSYFLFADDYYRGRDYDRRDYDRRDSDRRDYREDRYYSRSRY